MVAIGALAIVYSISKNSGIYDWDSGGYWHWSYTHTDKLYSAPTSALNDLWYSITNSDYNLILPTVISLPLRIFGCTFLRYVLINYFMSLVPALFIVFCIFLRLTSGDKKTTRRTWLLALFMLSCFVVPFDALLKGYIDVAELIPISLLLALFLKFQPTKKAKSQILMNVSIGLLLVVTFLFRRYTAFFAVGYVSALVLYSVYCLIRLKRISRRSISTYLKNTIANLAIVGGTSLTVLLVFFNGLVFRILGEDYATLYSAYNADLITKASAFPSILGYFFVALAIFAVVYSLIKRKYRKISVFCVTSIIITIIAFWRVQIMGCHQMYTINIQVLILDFLGLYFIMQLPKKVPFTICKIIVLALIALEPLHFFSTHIQKIIKPIDPMFSECFNPIYHSDLDSLRSLRDYLNESNDGNYVYVLASSPILNSDTLKVMDRPKVENAVMNLVDSHNIDLRDGFPEIFFAAHTIVTTNPIQTHLKEGSQEIIRYLSELIQQPDSYLGRHFVKDDKEFSLQKDVTALVYHKISPLDDEDYEKLTNYFDSLYPDHQARFGDRIHAFQEDYKQADHSKEVYYVRQSSR
ncbi:hypothetical protein IJH02_00700 [Candidatus Saccharibacteria bacterium]|nr:hypothetical protein [Candidatus Saccharibacteria bacterium]